MFVAVAALGLDWDVRQWLVGASSNHPHQLLFNISRKSETNIPYLGKSTRRVQKSCTDSFIHRTSSALSKCKNSFFSSPIFSAIYICMIPIGRPIPYAEILHLSISFLRFLFSCLLFGYLLKSHSPIRFFGPFQISCAYELWHHTWQIYLSMVSPFISYPCTYPNCRFVS